MSIVSEISILWIIRFILVGLFFLLVIISGIFLKDRKKNEKILENRLLNVTLVIVYSIIAYASVLLPSDPAVIPNQFLTQNLVIHYWYIIIGIESIILGLFLYIVSLRIRKTVGAQDTGRLITSGPYSFCRHPLYLACSLICLGLALVFNNLDGLLVVPLITLINLLMGKIEEKFDVGIRFKDQYPQYKMQTKAFGPLWFWIILIIAVFLPIIISLARL